MKDDMNPRPETRGSDSLPTRTHLSRGVNDLLQQVGSHFCGGTYKKTYFLQYRMREFFGHAVPRNEEDFQKTTYYANWRNAKWHNRWVCFERLETPLAIIHGAQDKAVAPFLGDQVSELCAGLAKTSSIQKERPPDTGRPVKETNRKPMVDRSARC